MDRLSELKAGCRPDTLNIEVESLCISSETKCAPILTIYSKSLTYSPLQTELTSRYDEAMVDFFGLVDCTKVKIVTLRDVSTSVKSLQQDMLSSTTDNEEESVDQNLSELVVHGNKIAKEVKTLLASMNSYADESNHGIPLRQSHQRIRKNLTKTLTMKFIDILRDYQTAQIRANEIRKKRISQRIQIVKPDATQEEIDAIMRSGQTRDLIRKVIISPKVLSKCFSDIRCCIYKFKLLDMLK